MFWKGLLLFVLSCMIFGFSGALFITWLLLTIYFGYKIFMIVRNKLSKKEDVKADKKSDENSGDE